MNDLFFPGYKFFVSLFCITAVFWLCKQILLHLLKSGFLVLFKNKSFLLVYKLVIMVFLFFCGIWCPKEQHLQSIRVLAHYSISTYGHFLQDCDMKNLHYFLLPFGSLILPELYMYKCESVTFTIPMKAFHWYLLKPARSKTLLEWKQNDRIT